MYWCSVVFLIIAGVFSTITARTIHPEIVYRRDGDILLGGLFPLHFFDVSTKECEDIRDLSAFKNLEGMVYAINVINNSTTLLDSITLGFEIYDTCFDYSVTVARCLNFLPRKREMDCFWESDGSLQTCRKEGYGGPLVGVVGAQRSVCSMEASMLLATDVVPIVSYLSTGDELSNRNKYPYLMRTVAPDNLQVKVIRDLLLHFGWTFVNFLYSNDNYGQTAFLDMSREQTRGFCISFSQEVSTSWGSKDFDKLVGVLRTDPHSRATVVILFMYIDQARLIMEAVQRADAVQKFTWVVSDAIGVEGGRTLSGIEDAISGSIAVVPFSKRHEGFDLQFYTKDYGTDPNPWGREFQTYYCATQFVCPSNITDAVMDYSCTDTLVMDSVFAFAYALHGIYNDICANGTEPKACLQRTARNGSMLYSYMREVSFVSLANGFIAFNDNGDAEGKYAIENYQIDNVLHKARIGTWNELLPEGLRLIVDDKLVDFGRNESSNYSHVPPASVCSQPCATGLVKVLYSSKTCCWECDACHESQIVINATVCSACPQDTWPDMNRTVCVITTRVHFNDSPGLGWTMLALGCFGFIAACGHIILMILSSEHVLIRGLEPVLTSAIFLGVFLSVLSSSMHSIPPHPVVCVLLRTGVGLSLVLIYAPLAIKTIRCYRTFRTAKSTASQEEADLWNSKKQLTLVLLATTMQLIISAVWLVTSPPDHERDFLYSEDGGVYHYEACKVPELQPIGDILFSTLFLLVGCVFSILARALPDNNYEIRLVTFSLFGSGILFFSVVVPYFTNESPYRSGLYIAIGMNVNALFVMACIFTPKVYVACFGSDPTSADEEPDPSLPAGLQGVYRPRLKSRSSSLSLIGRDIRPRNRSKMATVGESTVMSSI